MKSRFFIALSYLILCLGIMPVSDIDFFSLSAKTTNRDDIKTLKEKQKQLKNQMNNTEKKLSDTRKNMQQSLQELERLNADIESRDLQITNRNNEILSFSRQKDSLNKIIAKLTDDYNVKQRKYADMIYYAYITKSQQDKFLYVLSSKNFQEGYRRFQYLSSLAEMRKQQSESLSKVKQDIQVRRDKVDRLQAKTAILLREQEQAKEQALRQKQKQNTMLESLRTREREIRKDYVKQQTAADNINQKIQDMIAKEAALAAERARKKAQLEAKKKAQQKSVTKPAQQKTTTSTSGSTTPAKSSSAGYAMSNEEKITAGGFEKNKGLLMWPVKGIITGSFGKHPHPILKDVVINNKGIYITASTPGANALAVYDGTVSQCFAVPGGNNAVILRHGNYLTVYANLTQIFVKNGQKIKRGTPIGKIYKESDNKNKTKLFFQVWREKTLLNPQVWLRK